MLMKILFFIYATLIPLVPLWGAEYYRTKEAPGKRNVCLGLFVLQTLISAGSILTYWSQ